MVTLKIPITSDDHILGKENAPLTLVEYGDYQCSHCGEAFPIVKEIVKKFGNRLCFVFRNFPLNEIHQYAKAAAATAEFANDQGLFWEMHDMIYENQESLNWSFLLELTARLGLSPDDLEKALRDGRYENKIKRDFIGGVKSGVNGTPTFFINEVRYNGPVTFDEMVEAMKAGSIK